MQNKFTILDNYLIWCSAHDKNTLQYCTPSEIHKAKLIGSIVNIPVIIALGTGSWAAYLVSGQNIYAGIVGGLVWGFITLLLERSILGFGRYQGFTSPIFWYRVCLAIALGLFLSVLCEIGLFHDEIKEQLYKERVALEQPIRTKFDSIISVKQTILADARKALAARKNAFINEADGTGGSHQRGIGNLVQLKKEAYTSDSLAYITLETTITKEIQELEKQKATELTRLDQQYGNGLLAYFRAIYSMNDPVVVYFAWVIRILLLLFDLFVVFLKATKWGDIGLYYQVLDLHDQNRLDLLKKTNESYLKAQTAETERINLEAFLESARKTNSILLNAHITELTTQTKYILAFARNFKQTQIQIESTIPDSPERITLLKKLEIIYNSLMNMAETITGKTQTFFESQLPT